MLDKASEKKAENMEIVREPEEVRASKAVEVIPETEAAGTEDSEQTAAVEAPTPAEGVKAGEVAEELKENGYHSTLDGTAVEFELQYREQETDMENIARRVREDYAKRGNDASAIELIQVYLKPTDYTAYYVINNLYEGKIPLF